MYSINQPLLQRITQCWGVTKQGQQWLYRFMANNPLSDATINVVQRTDVKGLTRQELLKARVAMMIYILRENPELEETAFSELSRIYKEAITKNYFPLKRQITTFYLSLLDSRKTLH